MDLDVGDNSTSRVPSSTVCVLSVTTLCRCFDLSIQTLLAPSSNRGRLPSGPRRLSCCSHLVGLGLPNCQQELTSFCLPSVGNVLCLVVMKIRTPESWGSVTELNSLTPPYNPFSRSAVDSCAAGQRTYVDSYTHDVTPPGAA